MLGTIPDKLLIVQIPELRTLQQTVDGKIITAKVKDTFFTDADGKTETAIQWGTRSEYIRGENGEVLKDGAGNWLRKWIDPILQTLPNEPITMIRLWTIECRSEGGRAYKCIDQYGSLFDLREDIFLESLYAGEVQTINKKVFLTGQYIWSRSSSQMKLVRYKSDLYEQLMKSKALRSLKNIPGKDMEIGGVYESRSGERVVYVGRKDHVNEYSQKKIKAWNYVDLRGPWHFEDKAKWEQMTLQEQFDSHYNPQHYLHPYSSNKTLVRKIGQISIPNK
jgi:hypothetical protein